MRIEGEEEGVKRGGGKVEERMAKGWMGRKGKQKGKDQGPEKRKGREREGRENRGKRSKGIKRRGKHEENRKRWE